MTVSIQSEKIRIREILEKNLIREGIAIVTQQDYPDVEISVTSANGVYFFEFQDLFGKRVIEGHSPITLAERVARVLKNKENSLYWISLSNHYRKTRSSRSVMSSPSVDDHGQVAKGTPIRLDLATSIDGFVSIFSPEDDGKIIVLFPNSISKNNAKRLSAFENTGFFDLANITINAATEGPTYLVMLVSANKRSFAQFHEWDSKATFYNWNGTEKLDPRRAGPGVYLDSQEAPSVARGPDGIDAASWDIRRACFFVGERKIDWQCQL